MIKIGSLFFKYRNYIFPVVFILSLIFIKPKPFLGSVSMDRWMDFLGMMVALSGEILRILVIGYIYIKRGGKNKRVYAEDLVQGGLFALVRNPLYLGNIIILIGIAIIINSEPFYIIGIPFFVFFYFSIVIAEEDFLRKKFGSEYEEYCKRVNRFLPDFKRLREATKDIHFNWKRVISAEYGTFFAGIYSILFLILWEKYYFFGYSIKGSKILDILYLYILFTFLYIITRYLKKSGRLSS
jgi:protein-S-isoprenylcysteine O-methyltransferase Ste14